VVFTGSYLPIFNGYLPVNTESHLVLHEGLFFENLIALFRSKDM